LAEPVLGKARSRSALDGWWRVHDAQDVGRLIQLLDLEPPAPNNLWPQGHCPHAEWISPQQTDGLSRNIHVPFL